MKNLDNVTNVWGKVDERRHEVLEVSVQGMRNRWPLGFPLVKFRNAAGEEYAHSFKDNVQSNKVRVELNDRDVKRAGVCVMTVEWHEKGRVVASREYMGLIEGKKMEKPKYEAIGGEEDCGGGNGGGGLPEGGEPYKALVTDSNGNTVWEDRLAYKMAGKGALIADLGTLEFTGSDGWYRVYKTVSGYQDYEKLVVVWDGVEYVCAGGNFYIGNWAHYNPDGEDTGEPFLYHPGEFGWGTTQPGSHSIAVYAYGETIKPIDPDLIGGWKALGEKTENVTIEYDGDVTGKEHIELVPNQLYVVKLSDNVPGKDEFIGAEIDSFAPEVGVVATKTVTSDIITETDGGYVVNNNIFVVKDHTAFVAMSDVSVTSNGIWIVYGGTPYISTIKYVGKTITLIPKEYLPEDIGGGVMRVLITMDDNDDYVASKTYDEITEAFAAGKAIECVLGDYVMQMTELPGASGMSAYISSPEIVFSSINKNLTLNMVKIDAGNAVYYESHTVTVS